MAAARSEFLPVRLSLDRIPERDRMAVFREVIGRQIVKWDLTPAPETPLSADLEWLALPSLEIVSGTIGPTVIRRTPELIADGNDGFSLSISLGGRWRMAARGREFDDRQGRAGLACLAEPLTVESPARSRFLVLQIPRAALAGRIADLDDATLRPIAAHTPAFRLLESYLRAVGDGKDLTSPALRAAVATHLTDLICLVVGATEETTRIAGRRGAAAARLDEIKRGLERDLARTDLTAGHVADRHGLSPRRLQRLFERDGSTFSQFLRRRRLARAHEALSDSAARWRSVADIAFDCGFGDVSHFNRLFRQAYAATPSAVRSRRRASEDSPEHDPE